MVINGNSGWRSPHAAALLQLSFFRWKNLENEEDDERRGEIKKMSQETSSNFDHC